MTNFTNKSDSGNLGLLLFSK